jgi:hypothetical protein
MILKRPMCKGIAHSTCKSIAGLMREVVGL